MSVKYTLPGLVLKLHGADTGAAQATETILEDIQTGETEGAGKVQAYGPVYTHIQTGQLISSEREAEINAVIVKLQTGLQQGKKVYKNIRHTGGSKAEAKKSLQSCCWWQVHLII